MIHQIRILPGADKNGKPEGYSEIDLKSGELYTIVGNTGSGKSRLIKDLEQFVQQDSVSQRTILLDGRLPSPEERLTISRNLIAHLGQNMRFVLDKTVEEFLKLHAECRDIPNPDIDGILEVANGITPEPVTRTMNLNTLSGGQSRALMIADISCICDSPVVLIDEIENAGIDKTKALQLLLNRQKLVLIVTHDLHTALMSQKRIIMENGGVKAIAIRTPDEEALYHELEKSYQKRRKLQNAMREGRSLL